MGQAAMAIPEKIFFKIGEVCDIVDVQAHVLRYWETEFPQLSPQKNRSGQRSYRRRDVEIALRIKELLYVDEYTIAGARKKLQQELRESSRLKIVPSEPVREPVIQPMLPVQADEEFADLEVPETEPEIVQPRLGVTEPVPIGSERRQALTDLASQLLELRELLKRKQPSEPNSFLRKY
ncbi:MAG: MerR family transcriptional regulator [Acidobacteria bacterium]|nr:MerR family transcriptional regulator [Acidobacteriota bacterium]MBK8811707.1 MerR family transcriptional regulator [Acidobacteriota bacterium]